MTKIIIKDNKVIFDGHANNKADCGTITNIVNTLAKSNNFKEISNENGYAEFESLNNTEFKFPPMRQYSFYNHDGTQMYLSDGTYDPGNETMFTLQNATTLYGVTSNGDGTMNKTDQMGDALDNDIVISSDLTTATFPFQIAGIATAVNGAIVYSVGDSWFVTELGETNYYIVEATATNFDVTINANGGNGSYTFTDATEITADDLNALKTQITRTGYLLTGLSLTAGGTAVTLPYSLTANTTMYCVWVEKDNLQSKVTKLITYGKSQLSSKGVTSTATTLLGVLNDISSLENQLVEVSSSTALPAASISLASRIYKTIDTERLYCVDFSQCYIKEQPPKPTANQKSAMYIEEGAYWANENDESNYGAKIKYYSKTDFPSTYTNNVDVLSIEFYSGVKYDYDFNGVQHGAVGWYKKEAGTGASFASWTYNKDDLLCSITNITYSKEYLTSIADTTTVCEWKEACIGGAKLNAPTISLNNDTLTLTNPATNGNFAKGFNIYSGLDKIATQLTNVTTLNLATALSATGTHTITAKCYGTSMSESNSSASVSYTKSADCNVVVSSTTSNIFVSGSTNNVTQLNNGVTNITVASNTVLTLTTDTNLYFNSPTYSGGATLQTEDSFELSFLITGDTSISITTYECFVKGTLIAMADGTFKKVEDIDYNDEVKGWSFDNGEQGSGSVFWMNTPKLASEYWEVEFANGALLKLVGANNKCHRIFNATQGKFIYPQDFNDGDLAFDGIKNEYTTIVRCEKITKDVEYYNFAVTNTLNNYANGILCGNRFSNIYPIEDMKFIKDNRQIVPREEYAEIPDYLYDGLRLAEQSIQNDCKDNVNYYHTMKEHIIRNYMEHDRRWSGNADFKQREFKK